MDRDETSVQSDHATGRVSKTPSVACAHDGVTQRLSPKNNPTPTSVTTVGEVTEQKNTLELKPKPQGVCMRLKELGVLKCVVPIMVGSRHNAKVFLADLSQLVHMHDAMFFSMDPRSPFYMSPQKRHLMKRHGAFLNRQNVKKYLVDFVTNHKPCSVRRVYYTVTNFSKKFPHLTTYTIPCVDAVTNETTKRTVVVWQSYGHHLWGNPRRLSDIFKRRKRARSSTEQKPRMSDVIACPYWTDAGELKWVATAPVQVVFLDMIHSIRLLDHIVPWLPLIIKDQRATEARRNADVAQCLRKHTQYRRKTLNPVKPPVPTPVMTFV